MAHDKSIFSSEYAIFLSTLRRLREQAGITQATVGRAMGRDQSVVSKCERGERRLDIIEVIVYCKGIGLDFDKFTKTLLTELKGVRKAGKPARRAR
jgi:transcriptional regulator with XRE-family HTH domain